MMDTYADLIEEGMTERSALDTLADWRGWRRTVLARAGAESIIQFWRADSKGQPTGTAVTLHWSGAAGTFPNTLARVVWTSGNAELVSSADTVILTPELAKIAALFLSDTE